MVEEKTSMWRDPMDELIDQVVRQFTTESLT
jgi:hypothetical protein